LPCLLIICVLVGLERWLNPEKPLAEQGVASNASINFKKKFFFSDKNIDANDPVQLNLMYMQTRNAILSGKHPCTGEEAVQLAVLQAQVQCGNHDPSKHKPGHIK
jgi:talin